MVNWFAVHGTAMNNTNKLVSGDNKGHASALFEAAYNPKGTLPGQGDFVGAFAATNLGARALSPTAHAALRPQVLRVVRCMLYVRRLLPVAYRMCTAHLPNVLRHSGTDLTFATAGPARVVTTPPLRIVSVAG
jgi:hypothetical protein